MRRALIAPDVEVYYAAGRGSGWRYAPPRKATIVDPGPYLLRSVRNGAIYLTSWTRDDTGKAVLVHVDGEATPRAVPAEHLRGPWLATLAATGRTVAGVKAHDAAVAELATSGRPLTTNDLLRLAARDETLPDDVFVALSSAVHAPEEDR